MFNPKSLLLSKNDLNSEVGWYKMAILYLFKSLISLGLISVTFRWTLLSIDLFKAPKSGWLNEEIKAISVFWSITSTAKLKLLL